MTGIKYKSILVPFILSNFALPFFTVCFSQEQLKMEALNRYTLMNGDTLYQFYAVKPAKKIKYNNDYEYCWYKEDSLFKTQGASNGKILHGSFLVYFPGKNLMEQGEYKYGLKSGIWKSWFPDGKLRHVTTWKNGIEFGEVEEFDDHGNKTRSGVFKNGLFDGYIIENPGTDKSKKTTYKKGKIVEEKNNQNQSGLTNEKIEKNNQ